MPYSAAQMYALVADVERYPEFLPWCIGLDVVSREDVGERTVITAIMTVAFNVVRERFTSRVTLDPARHTIDVRYIDGPFRALDNHWRFISTGSGSTVDFFIDFTFRSRTLEFLISGVFQRVVEKLVSAFEARARVLYGRPGSAPRAS